ncbi:MAG: hypothetical protein J0G29_01305 [Alphaproteobacteria bacterium]|nr:hypothetical protein [Alphaproteobacteria bacterium]
MAVAVAVAEVAAGVAQVQAMAAGQQMVAAPPPPQEPPSPIPSRPSSMRRTLLKDKPLLSCKNTQRPRPSH